MAEGTDDQTTDNSLTWRAKKRRSEVDQPRLKHCECPPTSYIAVKEIIQPVDFFWPCREAPTPRFETPQLCGAG